MSQSKVSLIRETIVAVTKILGQSKIPVTQIGSRAFVEHDTSGKPIRVNIPSVPDDASDELLNAIQGFIDHEVGHLLYSDFSLLNKGIDEGIGSLHNIVEDTFIERKMGQRFRGSALNLERVGKFFIIRVAEKELAESQQLGDQKKVVASLMVAAIRAMSGQTWFDEWMKDGDKWALFKPFMDELPADFADRLANAQSTAETLELGRELDKAVKRFFKNQIMPPPPPPPVNPCDDGEDTDGDSDKEGDQGNESESGDSEDDSDEAESDSEGAEGDQEQEQGDDEGEDENEAPGESGESDEEADEDENGLNPEDGGSVEDDEEADEADGEPGGESDETDSDADEDSTGSSSGEDEGDEDNESSGSEGDDSDGDDSDGADAGIGDAESEGDPNAKRPEAELDEDGTPIREFTKSEEGGEGSTAEEYDPALKVEVEGEDVAEAIKEFLEQVEGMDFDQMMEDLISEYAAHSNDASSYSIFTRDDDKIGIWQIPPQISEVAQGRLVKAMEDRVDHMLGTIQKDIERAVVARTMSRKLPGQRRGRLNSSSLSRLALGHHRPELYDDRVFFRREEHTGKDIAVSLVVDGSGSMRGSSIITACDAAYALSSVLDRLNISNEVLCFSTDNLSVTNIRALAQEVQNAKAAGRNPVQYTRVEALAINIFKTFEERMTPQVKRRYAAYPNGGQMWCNIDGECVEVAARRLLSRREHGKLMMVLSDGRPAGCDSNSSALPAHLKKVVKDVTKAGVNVIGIGIQTNVVKHYYPNNVVLNKIADLPTLVMRELKEVILKNAS